MSKTYLDTPLYPTSRTVHTPSDEMKNASPKNKLSNSATTSSGFTKPASIETSMMLRRTSSSSSSGSACNSSTTPKLKPCHPKIYTVGKIKADDASVSPRIFSSYSQIHQAKSEERRLSIDELLEGGLVRDTTAHTVTSPVKVKSNWKQFYIFKDHADKNIFKMYDQKSDAFLLSARRDKSTFWISQYECVPKLEERSSFNGVVKPVENYSTKIRKFQIFSFQCEHCDDTLQRYTCTHSDDEIDLTATDSATTCSYQRQHFADVTHTDQFIVGSGVQARYMSCDIPHVNEDLTRVVWCPRTSKDTLEEEARRKLEIDTMLKNVDISGGSSSGGDDDGVDSLGKGITYSLDTKLPQWNDAAESLVMKFVGRRITVASSKNMLLKSKEDGKNIMQFGKARTGKYHLDFKHPLSAIQAFGIALTTFAWTKNK